MLELNRMKIFLVSWLFAEVGIYKRKIQRKKKHAFDQEKRKIQEKRKKKEGNQDVDQAIVQEKKF